MTVRALEGTAPEEAYAGPPPTVRPAADQPVPGPPRQEAPAEQPEPAPPTPYLLAMRTVGWAWWRPVAGFALIAFLLAVGFVLTRIADLLTGTGADLDPVPLTWRGLLVTGLLLALALPAVLLAWPLVHGVGPGRGLSVAGRLRWPLLGRSTVLALATVGVAVALGVAGAVLLAGREVPGPVPELPWVLVVGLLTAPLRAAGEELLFRGYLSQAVAGWIGRPRVGAAVAALVSAVLWAALYGTDDLAGFVGRVALGLAASAVVLLTGGIEAAVALHAVCGVVVLVLGAVLGEGAVPGLVPGGPGAVFVLVAALGLAAFVGLVARRGTRS
ncbi:CPBP family intramembrane glutamic endopeptidase [Blastococcus goldschmidtiae]|uniref:CPBP family intramembrane glutamic endopeptidase n=1 Tax=Blastococcus goldschmidtiae TaxID=3075546 RepID=A0ABU2KAP5_9ACTN|nr:CPBP family intramembrane glutamic endopeptidase [Blastococcus sp. DSM 46792]MDT0277259.1 CPBP family intramembrane glutamic endopeptidase [Blastococcus sp. DSM 46792]